ncbi:MAG: vitamin K epoxide reductase family protein [Calditrichia bacterium]
MTNSSKKPSAQVPPGWDYNPAAWSQRIPIIILGFVGFLIAGYLALYQLEVFKTVFEPFFGDGSHKILNSKISHLLPVPDGAIGAFGYFLDVLTGAIGSPKRWKTMPWIVIIFGFAVGPLGIVSIMLVIFQPVLFNAWCTLCLTSALISMLMIGPALDEVLASLQYLKRVKRRGNSVWRAFWGVSNQDRETEA